MMERPAVQQAQHLGNGQAGGDGADKGRSHGLAGEQRDTACIELAFHQHALVGGAVTDIFSVTAGLPDFRCRAAAWQRVQAHGAEVAVPVSKAGFDDEGEPDAIEGPAAKGVVDSAERDGRLVVAAREGGIEQALVDAGAETALLGPARHRARLHRARHGHVGQDRGAPGRRRDEVGVLEDQGRAGGAGIGQQAERPEIGLAEMAQSDQPQVRRQVAQGRNVAVRGEPVLAHWLPEREPDRPAADDRRLALHIKERFAHRYRGSEHRRERHDVAFATGKCGVGRHGAAAPSIEDRADVKPGLTIVGRAANRDARAVGGLGIGELSAQDAHGLA